MKMRNPTLTRWLFCLALMLGLMLGLGSPAIAQDPPTYTEVSTWATLQEAINHSSTTSPAYLRLKNHLTNSSEPLTIGSGNVVILDLAGKTLSRGLTTSKSNGHVIGIDNNAQLTIEDSSGGSGKITGGNTQNGGGVYALANNARFTMKGGSITGNTASGDGGGVYLSGIDTQFIMEGGTISGNTANHYGVGGGVIVYNGAFTMSAGTITDNTGGYGGGVNVATGGSFTMTGGTIADNTATHKGGGVFVSNTVDTQFTMNGGTIQNNTAGSHGGGIYAEKAITLGGTPTITGNTVNGRANNVFLNNSVGDDKKINIVSDLTPPSDIPIGVTLENNTKNITSNANYDNDAAAQAVFTSDNPAYAVCSKNNQAALQAVHFNLWVGNEEVTGEHLSGNGWSFDPWTNTLRLNGLSYSGTGHDATTKHTNSPLYACIFYDGTQPLNLVIDGTNTVTNTIKINSGTIYSCGIYSTKDMTISGSGHLTTSAVTNSANYQFTHGIWCVDAALAINSGTIDSGLLEGTYGILATNGVTINDGTVRASGDRGIAGGDGQKLTINENADSVVITGRGTATDLSVANAVKGYGWTNKEGTSGQTEIPVNTSGQSLSSYKKLEFPTNTYTVTFKVTGGAWNDGTTADQLVTVKGDAQTTPTLTDADIPAVGARPASGYRTGSWRPVTPTAGTQITKDTTYTYAYTPKNKITRTVTFKVEHGAWDDGTTEDQTVTLVGYEGDTLKLKEDQIPAVGNKPDKGYQAGSWDTEPSPDTPVTEDTTYTYTYDDKPIIPTLYFAAHVENKGWDKTTTVLTPGQSVTVGTTGEAKRLEAVAVMVPDTFTVCGYAHVQNTGDAAVKEVTTSEDYTIPEGYKAYEFGSTGKARRLEAICVGILDDAGNYVPGFQYAAHLQNAGWQGYVRNGSFAGTRGMALRMEALRLTYADPDVVPPEKIN